MKFTTSVWTGIWFLWNETDFSEHFILYFLGNCGGYKILKIYVTIRLIPTKPSVPCKTPLLLWTAAMLLFGDKNRHNFSNTFGNMFISFRFLEFFGFQLPAKYRKLAFVPIFFRYYWEALKKIWFMAVLPGVCTRGWALQFCHKMLRYTGTTKISRSFFSIDIQKSIWKTVKT